MNKIIYVDFLSHHGVKGMKWGVRREARIRAGLARKDARHDKYASNLLNTRSKISKRIESKYDKKISKASSNELKKSLTAKKNYKLTDYNEGTKVMKKGLDHYKSVYTTYGNMKIKAINDKSIKKTAAYKTAGRNYALQVLGNSMYGRAYTTLDYASKYARGYEPQKESVKWKR